MENRFCTINECTKPLYCRGWCSTHYNRWRRTGDPTGIRGPDYTGVTCSVEGCNRHAYGRGLCRLHHHRFWKFGDPGEAAMRRAPNGSGSINAQGYRTVYEPGHPNANDRGRILEHVLVMSRILGRPIKKGESIHHKNGIRTDNRPENLELWNRSQPPGRRVADWLAWAVETYPDELRRLLAGEPINIS